MNKLDFLARLRIEMAKRFGPKANLIDWIKDQPKTVAGQLAQEALLAAAELPWESAEDYGQCGRCKHEEKGWNEEPCHSACRHGIEVTSRAPSCLRTKSHWEPKRKIPPHAGCGNCLYSERSFDAVPCNGCRENSEWTEKTQF